MLGAREKRNVEKEQDDRGGERKPGRRKVSAGEGRAGEEIGHVDHRLRTHDGGDDAGRHHQ